MLCDIARIWGTVIVLLMVLGRLTCAEKIRASGSNLCPRGSVSDSILGLRDSQVCRVDGRDSFDAVGVIEGDEVSFQRALIMVHKNSHKYVAILFYASWCPFSKACRPKFSLMSSLYPSVPHFAIEESSIRPSMLSKFGVHGFPTLFLINSTVRMRYHGSRSLGSLVAFYSDITGINTDPHYSSSINQLGGLSNQGKQDDSDPQDCPFTWARFPVNMLRQETYLVLATAFVLLRSLCFIFPALRACVQYAWRRHIRNASFVNFLDHPWAYLARVLQIFSSLKEPCKRSNLQEGAMNARIWASKSLASVSIGDASTSRGPLVSERR